MSRKSKFYDIIPKENKSIRNVSISKKELEDDWEKEKEKELEGGLHGGKKSSASHLSKHKNSIEKHDHKESSSVEIKKLERPITNVEEYDEDEYIEITDHKISDNETIEEVHILGENKEQIEKNKIPALANDDNFGDYAKNNLKGRKKRGALSGSYKLPVMIFVIALGCFFVLNFASSATVIIRPSNLAVSLGAGFKFDKGDGEVLQATSTDSVKVPASGTIRVDKKSTGTVVIFNNTGASQKLTKGTRMQTPSGLVYLLDKAVTVPAKKTVAKKIVPGSVTTTLTAEAVGEKYNSGLKDFAFPGFKGTAKFDTIYGRSKTSITGGYSGEVPNVLQKDITNLVNEAKEEMKVELLALLKSKADSQGFIINEDTLQYKIINSEVRLSADKKEAVVKVDGTLQAGTLLNASVVDVSKSTLGVQDVNGFMYELNLGSSTLNISSSTEDDQIIISGSTQLNVSISNEELAKSLENKTKKEALALLQQTKGVTYVHIKTFPFWKTTLPKVDEIKILVQY